MTVDQEPDDKQWFCSEILLRGMAPHEEVLGALDRETRCQPRTCTTVQNSFARLVQSAWDDNKFGPSKTYLKKLVHRFVRSIDRDVVDDDLVRLIHKSLCTGLVDLPNGEEACHLSFRIPSKRLDDNKMCALCDVRIRIFPQHNDVALKLWEAGACLAEYFLAFPLCVSGKSIVELGSGVGLTGIISAACNAREVHFTDYSHAWLDNIRYNININNCWVQERCGGGDDCDVPLMTQGYLNWEEIAKGHFFCNDKIFDRADILIAADVAYDIVVIPSLVGTFRRFLLSVSLTQNEKCCYLAATLRNKATHDALERELLASGISCRYVPRHVIESLPHIFPVYFIQRRNEIRVCILTLSRSWNLLQLNDQLF